MNYIYNQIIWKKESKKKLVKFLLYREDKDLIIYEIDDQIFQGPSNSFSKATCDEIRKYYKIIFDGNKQRIKNIKRQLKRPDRKKLLEMMTEIKVQIKKSQFIVDNLFLMNKITNSDNLNLSAPKGKITRLKNKRKWILKNYSKDMNDYKKLKQKIRNFKLKNGELRTERNGIIADLSNIKGCE